MATRQVKEEYPRNEGHDAFPVLEEDAADKFELGLQGLQDDLEELISGMRNEVQTVWTKTKANTDLPRLVDVRLRVQRMKSVLQQCDQWLNIVNDKSRIVAQNRCIELHSAHKFARTKGTYDDHAEFTCERCGFVTWNDDADHCKTCNY